MEKTWQTCETRTLKLGHLGCLSRSGRVRLGERLETLAKLRRGRFAECRRLLGDPLLLTRGADAHAYDDALDS